MWCLAGEVSTLPGHAGASYRSHIMVHALVGHGYARSVTSASCSCAGDLWSFLRSGLDVGPSTRTARSLREAHAGTLDFRRARNFWNRSARRHRTRPGAHSLPGGACSLWPQLRIGDVVVSDSYDRYLQEIMLAPQRFLSICGRLLLLDVPDPLAHRHLASSCCG